MSGAPKKRFGQNFLHDASFQERIVAALAPQPGDRVFEIGPGRGALTRRLVASGAHVQGIEIDRDLVAELRADPELTALELHQGDALNLDLGPMAASGRLRVIGNLPYNISTPLLFHLFDQRQHIRDMLFMLQEEVVERIVAVPGGKVYGRLSVMCQFYCDTQVMLRVPAGAFWPVPKVQSAVVRLVPKVDLPVAADAVLLFEEIVRQAFGQRRKMLRRSLERYAPDRVLQVAGIDGERRPETLGLPEWVRLTEAIRDRERAGGFADPGP